MHHAKHFYIDGEWVDPIEPALIDVIDPSTEEAYVQISVGSAADVDRAVAAAKAAFPACARTSRKERLDLLRAILAEYNKRRNDVGDAISREMGAPLEFARTIQAGRGTAHTERMISVLETYPFENLEGTTLIAREPIGVCGLITP
jgi:aldehyde dehydrogenase (NAD+)